MHNIIMGESAWGFASRWTRIEYNVHLYMSHRGREEGGVRTAIEGAET